MIRVQCQLLYEQGKHSCALVTATHGSAIGCGNLHSFGSAIKASAWLRRVLKKFLESLEDDVAAGYLMRQVNTGPRTPNAYGHTKRLQKDCTLLQVSFFLKRKPHKAKAVLERLEHQMRAERRAEHWSATDYQMGQSTGVLTKLWLALLTRSYISRMARIKSKASTQI